MKKLYITLMILLSVVLTVQAQDSTATTRWVFKPFVAGNFSRLFDAPSGESAFKRVGLEAGMEGQYFLNKSLSLSFGAGFAYDRFREDISAEVAANKSKSVSLTRKPMLRSLYIFKFPLLMHIHATNHLSLKTGVEPWIISNAVIYPGNAISVDRFQLAIPVGIDYDFGAIEVGVKYTIGTEKIAGHLPNSLALSIAVPIKM